MAVLVAVGLQVLVWEMVLEDVVVSVLVIVRVRVLV